MIRELIDTEVEAVVGGAFDFGNAVFQQNNATQVGLALGGLSGITLGSAGNAAAAQQLERQHDRLIRHARTLLGCSRGCAGAIRSKFSQTHRRVLFVAARQR